jgi:hypothetical protein
LISKIRYINNWNKNNWRAEARRINRENIWTNGADYYYQVFKKHIQKTKYDDAQRDKRQYLFINLTAISWSYEKQ